MIKEFPNTSTSDNRTDLRIHEFRFSKVEVTTEECKDYFFGLSFILPKSQYTNETKAVAEVALLKAANSNLYSPIYAAMPDSCRLLSDLEKDAHSRIQANTVFFSKYDKDSDILCYGRIPKLFVMELSDEIRLHHFLTLASVVRWYIDLYERTKGEDFNSAHISSMRSYFTGDLGNFLAMTASRSGIEYKLNITEHHIELKCLYLNEPCEFTIPTDIDYLKQTLRGWIKTFSLVDLDEIAVEPTLHPSTEHAVQNTCDDVKAKLLKAQIKYGLTRGWEFPPEGTTEGGGDGRFFVNEEQLNVALRNHLEKGDILDCIAYLTFLHTKGWKLNV